MTYTEILDCRGGGVQIDIDDRNFTATSQRTIGFEEGKGGTQIGEPAQLVSDSRTQTLVFLAVKEINLQSNQTATINETYIGRQVNACISCVGGSGDKPCTLSLIPNEILSNGDEIK